MPRWIDRIREWLRGRPFRGPEPETEDAYRPAPDHASEGDRSDRERESGDG